MAGMEYRAVSIVSEGPLVNDTMNDWAADGWEIFAVTNGHYGAPYTPFGVTLYMRRPKAMAAPTQPRVGDSAAASPPHKPRRK